MLPDHADEFGNRKLLGESNPATDRIVQSLNAANAAIVAAVDEPGGARIATQKNLAYSKLTTVRSADPWAFDQP